MNDRPFLLSVFDYTGEWAKPFADAGWKVLLWDKEFEGNILEELYNIVLLVEEEQGERCVDGLLAAPPCTDFAGSGARWWPEKDTGERWWPGIEENDWERIYFDSCTELSVLLVEAVFVLIDWLSPRRFWALEQPVGRIETLVPDLKPFRQMSFNPCDFGDPYTKRTILYGDFNTDLRQHPIEPVQGSKMHLIPPGPDQARLRSHTPPGFAQAFFDANNNSSANAIQQRKTG